MVEISIKERIKQVEQFLAKQEIKEKVPEAKKVEVAGTPFEGEYRSNTGLFKGRTQGVLGSAIQNTEVVDLLKKISENQEIDRKRYERDNPVEGDEPIYDWAEETLNPGEMVQFIFEVPEGWVFYFEYPNVTYNGDTTYYIWIDGVYQPTLSDTLQDFGDHQQVYKPPKIAYNKVEVWALNTAAILIQTYAAFFRGFLRRYRAIHREIKYESLEKEEKL